MTVVFLKRWCECGETFKGETVDLCVHRCCVGFPMLCSALSLQSTQQNLWLLCLAAWGDVEHPCFFLKKINKYVRYNKKKNYVKIYNMYFTL